MTTEEVRALSDEALDRLVAVEVMGAGSWLTRGSMWRANPFSTDGSAMLALIKRLRTYGRGVMTFTTDSGYVASMNAMSGPFIEAATLPRAVAEASVLAVMQEERA